MNFLPQGLRLRDALKVLPEILLNITLSLGKSRIFLISRDLQDMRGSMKFQNPLIKMLFELFQVTFVYIMCLNL